MRALAANGPLRPELNVAVAADRVYALASPEIFTVLTADLGWSPEQLEQWLTKALTAALLPPAPR